MNDDLDQNLADSLHRRAAGAPTDTMHFGDVRRRVRRRRQRHMAMGVAPALVGVGYLATRPVAEPTPSADSVDATWAGDATTTMPPMWTTTTGVWPGNVWPYRCLDESAYDARDGWTYYTVCEQMPETTVPYDSTVWTTVTIFDYYTDTCGYNTLPPVTALDGVSTTTSAPRVENPCGSNTTVSPTTSP